MDELINRLKEITNLSELENIDNINTNILIYAIAKSEKYELLNGINIRLNISDSATLEKLTDFLLSDEDILNYIHGNGFYFSKEELNAMFTIVFQKHQYSYKFDCFLRNFFGNKAEVNDFIKEHQQLFENYINEKKQGIPNVLKDCDSFVELILKGNHVKLVGNLENYSISSLKLLAHFLSQNNELPRYVGDDRFAKHLFEIKSSLDLSEFSILIDLLKEKAFYLRKEGDSEMTSFSILVNENLDYLIDLVSQTKSMPKCLAESTAFRDECIKRNRIDLAVKCILSPDVMQNETLINAYCNELDIELKDFYERGKWLLEYHKKNNNNVFNTFLATSLKNNIFDLNKEHFERFITDVEVQMSVAKLSDKELLVLSKVLNIYNYKEYDIAPMIVNVINNIGQYQELINSLDVENISEQNLKKSVSVFQLPNNQYQINNINSLQNYEMLKKQYFVNNYSNGLISDKDNLLKLLFNIDIKEAKYINCRYCYDDNNNSMLASLKNSELPQQIYNYLTIINRIIECDNQDKLSDLYYSLNGTKIYNLAIPFESYLRAQYTQLYSQSLYRYDEKKQVYESKDSILNEINYNGKNIQVCIPRANFNFLVHCVGTCSLASDVTDTNYRNDWLDRPQIQDHFVACSYINEKGIYSIRAEEKIIFGFGTLESSSILGMSNTDIDSAGGYSNDYNGSQGLQESNGDRAKFFVPSAILKTINEGYNEIVVERRNTDKSRSKEFKRKPDYIIMMAESMEQDNFNYLEALYQDQLSFITDEDKKVIQQIGDSRKLKEYLAKYKDIILQNASIQEVSFDDATNTYVDLIMKAKYYEDCLKASSEFDIPLVVVDKTYYFNKLLTESLVYDEETLSCISDFYSKADKYQKRQMFNMVAQGTDVTQVMRPKEPIDINKIF